MLILFIIIGFIHQLIGHCLIPLDPWVYYACVCLLSQSMDFLELPGWFLTSQEKSPREKKTSQKILQKIIFLFLVFLHNSLSQRMAESQKWELKYRLVNTDTLSDEC